jgi:hypothetical protein
VRWLIASVLLCAGCEPTEVEAGQAIILVALPITLIGMLLHTALTGLWHKLDASIQIEWRTSWKMLGLLAVLCVAVFVSGLTRGTDDWLGFAFWFVGMSYLSLYLIALRLGVTRSLRRVLPWAVSIPWLVLLSPAIYCAALGSADAPVAEWLQALWIFPGFGGYIAGGLMLIFVIEVVARLVIASRQPELLPRARISGTRSKRDE